MKILITGASRGIGLELTKKFAEQGHDVIAAVRNPATADKLASLKSACGSKISVVELDVADESSVRTAAQRVEASHGHVDVLINNAAIAIGRKDGVENAALDDYEATFQTNVFGPVRVCKHFIPLLRKSERAMILNMSSASGIIQDVRSPDYSYGMSKAALNMFTGKLRHELSGTGITVYAIHPGWVRTDQGGPEAPLDVSEPARQIYELAAGLRKPDHEGFFIHADGSSLPF
ncbi:SDR family oxidoreductase [Cohnella cellulosilytica]|uniref:SDR family oxidoreductase n=1 Tax=Cohnella cellulosilytica TaxID=986710 RepID=A0ABW2FKG6_9BACL